MMYVADSCKYIAVHEKFSSHFGFLRLKTFDSYSCKYYVEFMKNFLLADCC